MAIYTKKNPRVPLLIVINPFFTHCLPHILEGIYSFNKIFVVYSAFKSCLMKKNCCLNNCQTNKKRERESTIVANYVNLLNCTLHPQLAA